MDILFVIHSSLYLAMNAQRLPEDDMTCRGQIRYEELESQKASQEGNKNFGILEIATIADAKKFIR